MRSTIKTLHVHRYTQSSRDEPSIVEKVKATFTLLDAPTLDMTRERLEGVAWIGGQYRSR